MTGILSVTGAANGMALDIFRTANQATAGQASAGSAKTAAKAASDAGQAQDVVSLSAAAKSLAAKGSAADSSYFEQFMPTRQGFSSAALAQAVVDPGAESFSKGKTFAQVADAARAELDKQYAAMKASGKPFDYDSWEGQDWYSLMGNLDRRALAAVANNEGGKFTKQEQDIANNIMLQQQALANGLYSGPTRLEGSWVDKFANDPVGRSQANIRWLDQVSDDEKQTITWASARAGAQVGLGWEVPDGKDKQAMLADYQSDNPLVKLISAAMQTMSQGGVRSFTNGDLNTADDLRRQAWFKGFEDQLSGALAATKAMYAQKGGEA